MGALVKGDSKKSKEISLYPSEQDIQRNGSEKEGMDLDLQKRTGRLTGISVKVIERKITVATR